MPEVELGPVWLSLQLATVTVVVLLLVATPLAWWLAFTRNKARTVIEAVVAMPLVLPPTVLGFYLLVLLGPAGLVGSAWLRAHRHHADVLFRGPRHRFRALLFSVRCAAAARRISRRRQRAARGCGDARRRSSRSLLARRVAARAARLRVGGRAVVRAHARRVRRRAHGRRQHPRQNQSHLDRDLRARRDHRIRASSRPRGRAARVLVPGLAARVFVQLGACRSCASSMRA